MNSKKWSKNISNLSGKRTFVAGASGLVGSAVVRRLMLEPCEVLTAPRGDLDLRDYSEVQRYFELCKPDLVILAAAVVGGISDNMARPADFFTDNILIQTNVMKAAHEAGTRRLVFLGSSCIYPKDAPSPISDDALMSGALEPTNAAYAMAKIAGIEMVRAYRAQYGHEWISVMPCNLYGPGDRFDLARSHVIPALMMKAHAARVSGGEFVVWGSGKPLREFMHVDDAAEGIVFALQHYSSDRPLNIGAGEDISIADLAVMIAEVVGFEGKIVFDERQPDGVFRKLMDSTRINKAGWSPRIGLRSGLEETYAWYQGSIAAGQAA